jgi:hypothetical protein
LVIEILALILLRSLGRTMKKFLACALLALGLTFNVEAIITPVPSPTPPPSRVPDNGSTAVLLALGALALAAFPRRKKAAL